ncbi:calcium-activated chloride channel-domain-containing protein [Pelagophyceae sp. CCMP2097]|nr:calcium-activated chloride channel-domain-containing protein [Pelagophyceae sp. CCMP2097]
MGMDPYGAEVLAYAAVILALFCTLHLLTAVARLAMQPRPKYMRPDPLFRSYAAGQNWTWDFCMVFRTREAGEVVTDYVAAHSLRTIVERLEAGGLETKLFKSSRYDKIFLKIRCDVRRLKDQAAAVDYACLLNPDEVKARIEKGYKDDFGKYRWYPRRDGWSLPEAPEVKFSNAIVDTKGQSKYAYNEFIYGKYNKRPELQSAYVRYLPSNSIFRGVDRMKLIMGIMEGDLKSDGCSLKLRELIVRGAVLAIFPLHDDEELQKIQDEWLTYLTPPWKQPIVLVKDYFGEKVGMYFLFLGTYSTWLFVAGLTGVFAYALSVDERTTASRYATAVMAIFMSLWATLFLESWKATQATAKMQWGMTGFEAAEQDRPDFDGKSIHSPVTGMEEKYFPPTEKLRRTVVSYLQVALCMLYVALLNAGVFYMYAFLSRWPSLHAFPDASKWFPNGFLIVSYATNFALALIILVTNALFMPFATYMNNEENHRTETEYEDQLIAKVFLFQFVNSYCSLFYVGMAMAPLARNVAAAQPSWKMERFSCAPWCLDGVGNLLGTIFITRVILGNITEVVIPYFNMILRQRAQRRGSSEFGADDAEYENPFDEATMRKRQISPAEEQFEKDDYDYLLGTFDDYAELVIQFGYTTLFVSAFPLAPLFACVNNFIEIRTDGWKLCQNTRRPWPMGAEDIGTWEDILTIMSIIATLTNGIMVTWTSNTLATYTTLQRLIVFIIFEWVLVGAKFILMSVKDDIPPEVALQIERQNFFIAKIISNEKDEEKELDEDVNVTIDEPAVYSSDPAVRAKDADDKADVEEGKKED